MTVYFNELLALVKRSGFNVLSNTLITHCTDSSRFSEPRRLRSDVGTRAREAAAERELVVGGVRRLTERRWPRINHPGRGQAGRLDLT